MKPIFAILILISGFFTSNAQPSTPMTLKQVILKQLKTL